MKLVDIPKANKILPFLGLWLIKIIGKTIRITVIGEEGIRSLKERGERIVYAFFHGKQFLLTLYMQREKIAVLSSPSRDGEIHGDILSKFGYEIVKGSSAKGGVAGLIGLRKKAKEGYNIGLAVDGPRGPYGSVKDGVFFLAKNIDAYICPIASSSKPCFIFKKAWDRYELPYPMAHGIIIFGEPYKPTGTIEEEREILKEKLISLAKKADTEF